MSDLSPKSAKQLERILKTLDKALDQMSGNTTEVYELIENWRGSMNIRQNIAEFVDHQRSKLR